MITFNKKHLQRQQDKRQRKKNAELKEERKTGRCHLTQNGGKENADKNKLSDSSAPLRADANGEIRKENETRMDRRTDTEEQERSEKKGWTEERQRNQENCERSAWEIKAKPVVVLLQQESHRKVK